jgi:hypothetical protein
MEYVDELAGDHPSNDPYWRLGALPLPELDRLDLGVPSQDVGDGRGR